MARNKLINYISLIFLITLFLGTNRVKADDVYIHGEINKDGYITISGNIGKADSVVSLYALKPNRSTVNSAADFDYIGQIRSDSDGHIELQYLTSKENGIYDITIQSSSWARKKTTQASYFSFDRLKQAAEEIKNDTLPANSPSEDGNKNIDVLKYFFHELTTIDNHAEINFCDLLEQRRNDIDVSDFDTSEDLSQTKLSALIHELVCVSTMNTASTEVIENVIENTNVQIGFMDLKAFKTYSDGDASLKNKINTKLIATDCYSAAQWRETFNSIVILTALSESDYTTVMGILEQNEEIIGISFGKYNTLSKNKKLYAQKYMISHIGSFTSIDKIKTVFDKAVTEAESQSDGNSNGGSGGGNRGGGSTSSGAAGTAQIKVIKNNETNPIATNKGFEDLDSVPWAKESIQMLYNNGAISGKSATEFMPNDIITREEFVAITVRAFKLTGDATVDFKDVGHNAWYYEYIKAAMNHGIITGESENSFGVGKKITREQIAAIVYRLLAKQGLDDVGAKIEFADAQDISEYAKEAVSILVKKQIINGYGDNTFKAKNNATRAEAAVILARVYELLTN